MSPPRWFLWIVVVAIMLWGLTAARAYLIPIAIALVLFSLLAALIDWITKLHVGRWSVPRPLATVIGLIIIAYGLSLMVSVLSSQVEAVIAASPRYISRIEALLSDAAEFFGRDIAEDLQKALSEINLAARIPGLVGSAGATVTTITLIVLYMGFMFVERGAFQRKLDRLLPDHDQASRVRAVILSISDSVQRYFTIKLFVSALTGLAAYAVMKPMGLDFAETWALLAVLLNFIPNIGSAIATILPAIVALVQFDTLGPFLVIAFGVSTIQLVIGNFVEPALMGRSLNLSPLVIILSLTFWAFVWGIVGMFLSVPIMVIVLIVCSQIPAWRPVAVILSRDGRIPDSEIANDPVA
ncbi:AI-2E family transporter [Microbaculum marinum]|uniref:AI-2E family transporter n=1 Tax=Microbaculum marinum TaxID=1764581 RepID=A0AAW9RS95_9HYPH